MDDLYITLSDQLDDLPPVVRWHAYRALTAFARGNYLKGAARFARLNQWVADIDKRILIFERYAQQEESKLNYKSHEATPPLEHMTPQEQDIVFDEIRNDTETAIRTRIRDSMDKASKLRARREMLLDEIFDKYLHEK